MPCEFVFTFDGGRATETTADAQRRDVEIKGGQRSLNEARAEMGLPLIDAPEADSPILSMGAGLFIVTPEGITPVGNAVPSDPSAMGEMPEEEVPAEEVAPVEESDATASQEVKAFMKWAKKGNCDRDFEFKTIDAVYAATLNRAARDGDLYLIKSISEVALKKV